MSPAEYSKIFYKFLTSSPAYLGCGPIYYPLGYHFKNCYRMISHFTPGQLEDLFLNLINNHTFLSCIACAKASPFSRNKRRIAFTIQQSVIFFFTAFNFSLNTVGQPIWVCYILNILVVTPLAPVLNKLCDILLLCPCFENEEFVKRHPKFVDFISSLGVTIAFCLMITALSCLLVAALFTVGQDQSGIILQYFLTVHLYGFIRELLISITSNFSWGYMSITLFPDVIDFLNSKSFLKVFALQAEDYLGKIKIGLRFIEMIVRGETFETLDYSYRNIFINVEFYVKKDIVQSFPIFKYLGAPREGYNSGRSNNETSSSNSTENPMIKNS